MSERIDLGGLSKILAHRYSVAQSPGVGGGLGALSGNMKALFTAGKIKGGLGVGPLAS